MYSLVNISKNFYQESWKTFLQIENKKAFVALKNVNLTIKKGDIIGVVGRNGSGKSTFLKLLSGILIPDEGIIYGNENVNISYISGNERSFFWRLTVNQNLHFFGSQYGLNKAQRNYEIDRAFSELGIRHLKDLPFMQLSTGNKKKISIARALIRKPDLFLFDEITTSLDKESTEHLLSLVLRLHKDNSNITTLWASHDLEEINTISTKILKLDNGGVKSFG